MEVEFDQHYLKDVSVIVKSINESNIVEDDIILEIGPGNGILTKAILTKKPKKLIAIEIDEKHKTQLDLIKDDLLEIHYANALEIFGKLKFNKIIANIPYSITEQLYSKILEKKIPQVTLLHGIDFYKNIVSRDTRWKYFVTSLYDIQLLDEVPGNSFEPPTKIKSALVKLTLKENFSKFDDFLQILFLKRQRSLNNALIFSLVDLLNISKKESKSMIKDLNISQILLEQKVTQIKNEDLIIILENLRILF